MDQMKSLDYNTLHVKIKDQMDQIKNLDCNQIKIFINLETIVDGLDEAFGLYQIKICINLEIIGEEFGL